MTRNSMRFASSIVLAGSAIGLLTAAPTLARPVAHQAAATALTVYHNTALGFSITYPSTWKTAKVKGLTYVAEAPGNHAGLVVIVKSGSESAAALKADLKTALSIGGALTSTPKFSTGQINGVSFPSWSATTTASKQPSLTVTFGLTHGKYTYLFATGVDTGLTSTKANAQAVENLIASVRIK